MYGADTIKQMLQNYGNGTGLIPVFLCCVIWILIQGKTTEKKYVILYGVGVAAIGNPLSLRLLRTLGSGGATYRFLWLFPMIPVMAYVATSFFYKAESKWERTAFLLMLFVLLSVTGNTYLTSERMRLPENVYGIPQDAIEVSNVIEQKKEEAFVVVAMDQRLQRSIRQWNAAVICGISREDYLKGIVSDEVFETLSTEEKEAQILMRLIQNGEQFDEAAMRKCIQDQQVDFLVLYRDFGMEAYMNQLGCCLVGENQTYEIYETEGWENDENTEE